jgi:cysteine desulfurase
MDLYLDHNATTRPWPEVMQAMSRAMHDTWGNPSSTHAHGQAARRLLIESRGQVAAFLGCQPAEVVFTSGATEANHMAVLGCVPGAMAGGPRPDPLRRRWLLSAVEHPGLLALAARLADAGVPVDLIPVDGQGRLDLACARSLIGPDAALVSVMGANNETGVIMPVAEVSEWAHAQGARVHVDATQLAGRQPLDFARSGVDLMSVSAHKIGGPKGVGALVVRKGCALTPMLAGRQERHRRGGTENLPAIAGFAAACARTAATLAEDASRMRRLRDRLEHALIQSLPWLQVHVHGRHAERLPNTSSVRLGTLHAEPVLARLEQAGVLASSGSACSAGGSQPSHVMLALGETVEQARAALRFSLGVDTTEGDIDRALAAIVAAVGPLLAAGPSPSVSASPPAAIAA